MSEQAESLPSTLSRRTILKGLAGCALALAGIGCSSASSSSAHVTPTAARTFAPSPTPTSTSTPKPGALGSTLLTYSGHTGEVFAVVWHDARIASGGADGTVQVWNANTGHTLVTYTGHSGQVTAISWSPDGTRIATASWDRTVQVWASAGWRSIFTYTFSGYSAIYASRWSPDSESLASRSCIPPYLTAVTAHFHPDGL